MNAIEHELMRRNLWISVYAASATSKNIKTNCDELADYALKQFDAKFKLIEEAPSIELQEAYNNLMISYDKIGKLQHEQNLLLLEIDKYASGGTGDPEDKITYIRQAIESFNEEMRKKDSL